MQSLRVAVQPGTGYELLMSALTIGDPATRSRLDLAPTFQRRAKAIDPVIGETFRHFGREPFICLLGWVQAMVDQPTAARVVDAIAAADADELKLTMLGYYRRAMRIVTPAATIRAAADGERSAVTEMRRTSYPTLGHWQRSLRYLLATDAASIHGALAPALRAWHSDVFAEVEADLEAQALADAEVSGALVASRPLDDVLAEIVPGLTFAREVGQSLVVLVPSVVIRPTFALTDYGSTLVIAYPAADRTSDGQSDARRLATLADALGDELRVRVLEELRAGATSTSELARRLGVPRTSLQHHLNVLINAGFAALAVDDARSGALELRRSRLLDLGRLAASLAEDDPAPPAGPDTTGPRPRVPGSGMDAATASRRPSRDRVS